MLHDWGEIAAAFDHISLLVDAAVHLQRKDHREDGRGEAKVLDCLRGGSRGGDWGWGVGMGTGDGDGDNF